MFTEKDLSQMQQKGIAPDKVKQQIGCFREGFSPALLDRPATVGDGILRMDQEQVRRYSVAYEKDAPGLRVVKFVPASGAATRMFRDLYTWRDKLAAGTGIRELFSSDPAAAAFFGGLRRFAFWEDLSLAMFREDLDAGHLLDDGNYLPLLDFILYDHGLDYASLPKGLLAFHSYGEGSRTPFEEHLVEGARYAADGNGRVCIHFTVSPEHLDGFRALLEKVRGGYEKEYGVALQVDFSLQKPSTDTVAADLDGKPFRALDGSLVFRPGGHGALIENLNELDGDIFFVKNIDNVVPDHLREPTVLYKKALGGLLLELTTRIADWMKRLEEGPLPAGAYREAVAFATERLFLDPALFPEDAAEGSRALQRWLHRPVRVCGMVRNQGEPGGGPFWVKNRETGTASLQVVESAQVNLEDAGQSAVFSQSTHFNPVDLVCAVRDHRGQRFDLRNHVDPDTGFISKKSMDGRTLQALELPGLWNGAMADWTTVFAEVPLSTFNPVKTVNDLLRESHQ